MAKEKGFFGASKSEIRRMKKEVYKDYGLGKVDRKSKRKKKRY